MNSSLYYKFVSLNIYIMCRLGTHRENASLISLGTGFVARMEPSLSLRII